MNQKQTDLGSFLKWLSNLEMIDVETRRDFLGHILKVGYLDEKSINFISDSLNNLEKISKREIEELQREFLERTAELELEKNKETSTVERIYRAAEKKLKGVVENFKVGFQFYQKSKAKKEEFAEETENQLLVDRLKASLN